MPLAFRMILGGVGVALAIAFGAYVATIVDPTIGRADIAMPDWPAGAPPVRVALLADIHLGNASMWPARLRRVVAQTNVEKPDLVILAGDFLAGYDKPAAAQRSAQVATELSGLHAPLGTLAVIGNHDQATNPDVVTAALERVGITVLKNSAIHKGPLAIGGLGDGYSGNAKVEPTLAAMAAIPGARVAVMHSPADATTLPANITLVLAGHTHCGQIVLPGYGPPVLPSVPARYACGVVTEGARRTVVTGGLGTSTAPFRIGAPPDLWLLTLGPVKR